MLSEWLNRNLKSENSKNNYRKALKKFADFIFPQERTDELHGRKTSKEEKRRILDGLVEEYSSSVSDTDEFVEDFRDYLMFLDEEEGYSSTTIKCYSSVVKTYFGEVEGYKISDEQMRKYRRRNIIPAARAETADRKPTKKELRSIMTHLDPLTRSLVLFLSSSGARIGEALKLAIDDIEFDATPPRADLRHTKTGETRTVFFTPEAKEGMVQWLSGRKDLSKKTTRENATTAADIEHDESDRIWNVTSTRVRQSWARALKRAGLDEKDTKTGIYKLHLHTLRKYFRTNLDLDADIVHALMGHSQYLDKAYLRHGKDELGRLYKGAMGSVSIYEAPKDRKKEIKSALAMQGYSISDVVEVANEMGITHPETNQPITGGSLPTVPDEKIGEIVKEARQQGGNVPANRQTQKIISEDELRSHLKQGWKYIDENSRGVIVER